MAKGLVTEASPLSFPEGATTGEVNFTIDREGLIRKRRLGLKNLVTDFTIERAGARVENVVYWRGPSLVCVIVTDDTPQTVLRFHAVDADFSFIVELPISNFKVGTQVAQTTSLLAITLANGEKPIICEYNQQNEEIIVQDVEIYVRDFELVDDDLSASARPSSLSENHEYNLYNAGWYQDRPDAKDNNTVKNTAQAFRDEVGRYPSNADVMSVGIIDDGNGKLVFDAEFVKEADFGNSVAPRGHYVFSILDFDRDDKLIAPSLDGTPSNTVSVLGSVTLDGVSTFDPDEDDGDGGSGGGGGQDPYIPPDEFVRPPDTEIP